MFSEKEADKLNDEQLCAAAMTDPSAAAELMARLLPSIRAAAQSISPAIAEDLFQEGMLGALSAIGGYDPDRGSVRTYLITCARNKMLSAVAKNSLLGGVDKDTDELGVTEQGERFEELYAAIQSCLTSLERSVVRCYLMGLSYRETAEKLGIGEKSVDNAMQRARRKLREEFDINS